MPLQCHFRSSKVAAQAYRTEARHALDVQMNQAPGCGCS